MPPPAVARVYWRPLIRRSPIATLPTDARESAPPARLGWLAALIARIGAWVIHALIFLFGRTRRWSEMPWLAGPVGGDLIGDAPYREVAAAEGLAVERRSRDGGLVPSWDGLAGPTFTPGGAAAPIRDFYQHTTNYTMDVWSETYFPANLALALLVTTISRQVNQLNFPLSPLDTALGMNSEIILLRRPDGSVRYTGWFRTLARQERVLYTGFYLLDHPPGEPGPCVKVVFPMPRGNATVLLRPALHADGSFTLDSSGRRFGEAGFYRQSVRGPDRVRVWHIRSLKEHFRVYVDREGVLRCDHTVRFLGIRVLRLHYKIVRAG